VASSSPFSRRARGVRLSIRTRRSPETIAAHRSGSWSRGLTGPRDRQVIVRIGDSSRRGSREGGPLRRIILWVLVLLVADLALRVLAEDGELLREVTLDP